MATSKVVAPAEPSERLQVRYVPLETLVLWDRNPKKHDLAKLRESITRYGFKDPPKFEPSLNGGKGGIVEGNGRSTVLLQLRKSGADPPRGVAVDESGRWAVPVLFGVDAASQAEAESYGLDHNSLTLGGSGLPLADLIRIYDEQTLVELLQDRGDLADYLVSFSTADLDDLLVGPEFEPEEAAEQSRLDRKKPVTCPGCGMEFVP
jgi:hypothetical protein